ncbi:MAG: hypothetical protein ABIQ27_04970 [Flavobacterium sp.]|uniref:hypothetical protein n=1 Tax=Flavobacterium sp. TaxID=239 RepID=UPI003263A200
MKKVIVSLFLIVVFIISCKSKSIKERPLGKAVEREVDYIPYYLEVHKADSLYLINDFEKSYKLLDSLFKIYKPLNTDTYVEYGIYVNSAVMSGNIENIEEKVRYGYSNFGAITPRHRDWIAIDNKVFMAAKLAKVELDKLIKDYQGKLNLDLRKSLVKMYNDDQNVRNGKNSSTELQEFVDDINKIKLDSIFYKYSYPGNSLIGTNNAFHEISDYVKIDFFFLHQPNEFKDKYLPIILDNLKKGNCEPDVYAIIYDRKMIELGNKQYYGSYTCPDGNVCPLSNVIKIDSIRKSIGLPSIQYDNWRLEKFTTN